MRKVGGGRVARASQRSQWLRCGAGVLLCAALMSWSGCFAPRIEFKLGFPDIGNLFGSFETLVTAAAAFEQQMSTDIAQSRGCLVRFDECPSVTQPRGKSREFSLIGIAGPQAFGTPMRRRMICLTHDFVEGIGTNLLANQRSKLIEGNVEKEHCLEAFYRTRSDPSVLFGVVLCIEQSADRKGCQVKCSDVEVIRVSEIEEVSEPDDADWRPLLSPAGLEKAEDGV